MRFTKEDAKRILNGGSSMKNELHAEALKRELIEESKGYYPIGCKDGDGVCRGYVVVSIIILLAGITSPWWV